MRKILKVLIGHAPIFWVASTQAFKVGFSKLRKKPRVQNWDGK